MRRHRAFEEATGQSWMHEKHGNWFATCPTKEADCCFCHACGDCSWEIKFKEREEWGPLCDDCYEELMK